VRDRKAIERMVEEWEEMLREDRDWRQTGAAVSVGATF
jgi:hypothetical protein